MTSSNDLYEEILRLEEEMAAANCNGNGEFYSSHLADDAIAVAAFGVFGKDAIVRQVSENRIPFTRFEISDAKVTAVGKDGAVISYRGDIEALRDSQPLRFAVYATSVWRRDGEQWLAVLHQQTPITEA
jgi:hypothetical protein